jgi:3-deoxy-manno-octulosonate cytidylyltransferase (CMP-KDO synthetase)
MANIIVIPARMGSKRLPGKPLAMIGDKPMVVRVAHRATACACADMVIVATDHPDIAEAVCAEKYKKLVTAVMTPDCNSGTDRIASLIGSHIERNDIVVNLQGDLPFADPRIIDQLFLTMIQDKHIRMATACNWRELPECEDMYRSTHSVKVVMDIHGDALMFSRSPIGMEYAFYHHFGMYAYRHDVLELYRLYNQPEIEKYEQLEQLRALYHGVKIRVLVTMYEAGQEINTVEDLHRVQEIDNATV